MTSTGMCRRIHMLTLSHSIQGQNSQWTHPVPSMRLVLRSCDSPCYIPGALSGHNGSPKSFKYALVRGRVRPKSHSPKWPSFFLLHSFSPPLLSSVLMTDTIMIFRCLWATSSTLTRLCTPVTTQVRFVRASHRPKVD